MRFYNSEPGSYIDASPNDINVGDVKTSYMDDDSFPYVVTYNGMVYFGSLGSEHGDLLEKYKLHHNTALEGRCWRNIRAISNWLPDGQTDRNAFRILADALQKRLGLSKNSVRYFKECYVPQTTEHEAEKFVVEITLSEYFNLGPLDNEDEIFWHIKHNEETTRKEIRPSKNGMDAKDVWRHYEMVGENIKITETDLTRIISESVKRLMNENRLPSYTEWRQNIECEVMWHKHSGRSNRWIVGNCVFFDTSEHALNHLGPSLLKKVLQKVDLRQVNQQGFIEEIVTFPYPVGYQECVETSDADDVVYLQRDNRKKQSRFVLNRQPEPCNTVFIVLRQTKNDPYAFQIITGYVGTKSGKEPWDRRANDTDNEFWKTHALVSPEGTTKADDVGDEGYWRQVVAECVKRVMKRLFEEADKGNCQKI